MFNFTKKAGGKYDINSDWTIWFNAVKTAGEPNYEREYEYNKDHWCEYLYVTKLNYLISRAKENLSDVEKVNAIKK